MTKDEMLDEIEKVYTQDKIKHKQNNKITKKYYINDKYIYIHINYNHKLNL